jgi:peroxiredoxin Q/BCP
MIEIGKKAPAFKLPDQKGNIVKLSDYAGKTVVLYFYPKDLTSGCTQEACDFRDALEDFNGLNAVVFGISADPVKTHQKFAEKYNLTFQLLSDETKEVLEKYGVWKEKSMYGKKYMGIERTTVIVGADGKVKNIFPKVKVAGHIEAVKEALQA